MNIPKKLEIKHDEWPVLFIFIVVLNNPNRSIILSPNKHKFSWHVQLSNTVVRVTGYEFDNIFVQLNPLITGSTFLQHIGLINILGKWSNPGGHFSVYDHIGTNLV